MGSGWSLDAAPALPAHSGVVTPTRCATCTVTARLGGRMSLRKSQSPSEAAPGGNAILHCPASQARSQTDSLTPHLLQAPQYEGGRTH